MSKSPYDNLHDPITDITLLVTLKSPVNTRMRLWGENGPDVINWEDECEISDIYVNGKPFQGLANSRGSVKFSFSNRPHKKRTLAERLAGVMPSYWSDFFIGFKGHFCIFVNMDIARFDYVSKCNYMVISSSDMRDEKGNPVRKPVDYETYTKEQITSVASMIVFGKDFIDAGNDKLKPKPKPTLKSYFESMPEQAMIFN